MNLSDGEKLILMMLAEIQKHFKIQNAEFDPDFISKTITHDYLWGFNWAHTGIPFAKEEPPREVNETADILEMWSFLELSYDKLSPADKAKVKDATERSEVKFNGFDGNNENHYGIACYFVEDLKRYEHFKGRDLNSQMPSFVVQDFPALRTLGAWMQVGNERFDGEGIHRLYESDDYPRRRTR